MSGSTLRGVTHARQIPLPFESAPVADKATLRRLAEPLVAYNAAPEPYRGIVLPAIAGTAALAAVAGAVGAALGEPGLSSVLATGVALLSAPACFAARWATIGNAIGVRRVALGEALPVVKAALADALDRRGIAAEITYDFRQRTLRVDFDLGEHAPSTAARRTLLASLLGDMSQDTRDLVAAYPMTLGGRNSPERFRLISAVESESPMLNGIGGAAVSGLVGLIVGGVAESMLDMRPSLGTPGFQAWLAGACLALGLVAGVAKGVREVERTNADARRQAAPLLCKELLVTRDDLSRALGHEITDVSTQFDELGSPTIVLHRTDGGSCDVSQKKLHEALSRILQPSFRHLPKLVPVIIDAMGPPQPSVRRGRVPSAGCG